MKIVDTTGKTDKLFTPPRLIKQIKKLANKKNKKKKRIWNFPSRKPRLLI